MDPRELPFIISKPELKGLYQRLGPTPEAREQKLEQILVDFYVRMSYDIILDFFFTGKDVPAIARKQKEFLMRGFGAIPTYSGKAPADAHTELPPILEGMFNRRLQILEETLRSYSLNDEDIRNWISFENAFRGAVVK